MNLVMTHPLSYVLHLWNWDWSEDALMSYQDEKTLYTLINVNGYNSWQFCLEYTEAYQRIIG